MARILPLLIVFLIVGLPATAAEGVPFPTIPKAHGDACVRDAAFMRINHMDLLMHQRDETVHKGVRPANEHLNACLTCHAVHDDKGQAVSASDDRHFCRTCHDYAAVRVDCFECHASTPAEGTKAGAVR